VARQAHAFVVNRQCLDIDPRRGEVDGSKPSCLAALKIKRIALEHLFVASGGSTLSETMWLRSELAAVETQGLPVA